MAKTIMITNLQKDQVQRNGDPDYIYRKLYSGIESPVRFFLNNDEPRTRAFAAKSDDVVYYGVERHSESFNKDETYPTMACPVCRHKIIFDYYNNDGVGRFHCENCGHASGDNADYLVTDVDFQNRNFKLRGVDFNMPQHCGL